MTRGFDVAPAERVRCLTIHADYACRRTGACCTSRWRVPVEPCTHERLVDAIDDGSLRVGWLEDVAASSSDHGRDASRAGLLLQTDDLPEGYVSWLGLDRRGQCLFYETSRGTCAIHRQLGEDALPTSCRQFPRVSLTDARGTSVSLSHYCPTAANLIVDHDVPLAIVEAPRAFPPSRHYEGLDARGALPPLVRPGLLHSFDSYDLWERGVVALLAREELTAEQALACAAIAAERIRTWTPAVGPLETHVDWALARSVDDVGEADPALGTPVTAVRLWHLARAAVPAGVTTPTEPVEAVAVWERHAADHWNTWAPVVRRYLAARAFATWLSYQGRGLRTSVLGLVVTLGVLQAEVGRACAVARQDLDRDRLVEAIRAADLLVVHLVDPVTFAARLGVAEDAAGPGASPLEWLG